MTPRRREAWWSSVGVLLHVTCFCLTAVTQAGGSCNVEQMENCRRAVRDETLHALSSGGSCTRKSYAGVYTHVCTINAHSLLNDANHCCCAHDDGVFCCKYHQDGNIYRCNKSNDVIDHVAHGGVLSWEILLPLALVAVVVLACLVYCCRCKRHCCRDDHDSATEAECGGCCAQSDSDDESGKGGAPEDKNDELSPLNSGVKLLPAADFGHGDYTTYHVEMMQPTPCPHCGHPPLTTVQPSAPPAEDVGTCTDQVVPAESATMPPRANSDVSSLLRLGEHEPAFFARSNSVPATAPPHMIHSYTCPSCPVAAVAPPSYDDSRRDRIVL